MLSWNPITNSRHSHHRAINFSKTIMDAKVVSPAGILPLITKPLQPHSRPYSYRHAHSYSGILVIQQHMKLGRGLRSCLSQKIWRSLYLVNLKPTLDWGQYSFARLFKLRSNCFFWFIANCKHEFRRGLIIIVVCLSCRLSYFIGFVSDTSVG